jgi:hypothetical protein
MLAQPVRPLITGSAEFCCHRRHPSPLDHRIRSSGSGRSLATAP